MKKSKLLKKMISLTLIGTMLGSSVIVNASQSGSVTGEGDVEDIVYNIVVPTDLSFALDPFSQASTEGQVTEANYTIVNKSSFPAQVTYGLKLEFDNTDVTLLAGGGSHADYVPDDVTKTKKILKFGIIAPTEITGVTYAEGFTASGATTTYDYDAATNIKYFDPTDSNQLGFAFQLGKATPEKLDPDSGNTVAGKVYENTTDDQSNSLGVAAFRLYAAPNAYADWQEGDLALKGSYKLNPLTANTWEAASQSFTASGSIKDTRNLIDMTYAVHYVDPYAGLNAGFLVDSAEAGAVNGKATVTTLSGKINSSKSSSDDIEIPFYFNGETITALGWSGTFTVPSADYGINGNNLVIKKGSSNAEIRKAGVGDKAMFVTLSNGNTYNFTITVTN